MPIDKDQALERIGVFSGLAHKVRSQLAAQAGMQRLSKGSILFREGERAEFLYGLVEGTVTLSSGAANNETIAEFMGPGDLLLVPPALLCAPYMVSGQAASDLLVVMIPAAEFRRLAQSDISLSAAINRMLSTHWRLLLRQIVHTRAYDADTRLKNYLLDLAGPATGKARFNLPGSKKDLAAHLGVRRETLSRSLTRLAQLGVHSNGNNIEIDDLSRLRAAS
jgi:CRP/FNR family transcriptional activator FtrB